MAFATGLPRLTVLTVSERQEDDPTAVDARLRITLSERELFSRPVRIDFQGSLLARAIMAFEGFVLPSAGELHFSFAVGEAVIETYTLKVKAPPPRPVAQPQARAATSHFRSKPKAKKKQRMSSTVCRKAGRSPRP